MSWNLSLQLNNLYAAVRALQQTAISNPVAATFRINAPTATTNFGIEDCNFITAGRTSTTLILANYAGTPAMTVNADTTCAFASNITAKGLTSVNITGVLTYNLNASTGMVRPLSGTSISITLATADANNYSVGQIVFVQGNSNGLFNNINYTITAISSSFILEVNNPTSIPPLEVGGGGTVSGGTITTRNLTAVNLNGKLNVVGGTTSSGNVLFCNNTTSTTGNFDVLTDSNQHFRFSGGTGAGSNILTVGGGTNGGISIPSTAGTITCNQYTTNAAYKMILNSTEAANGTIEYQTSGVKRGVIQYANASFPLQVISEVGLSLETRNNGAINIATDGTAGINFIIGGAVLCGVNSPGFFINNCGYFLRGSNYNTYTSTSTYSDPDMVLYANGGGNVAVTTLSGATNGRTVVASTTGILSAPPSDERLKKNKTTLSPVLEKLAALNPITYEWDENSDMKKHPLFDDKLQWGFTAQNIQSQFPDLAYDLTISDATYLGFDERKLFPILVKGIQEQQTKITSLEAQLASLKAVVDALVAQKDLLVV